MPTYMVMHGIRPNDQFYGFPALPGTGQIKVATEDYDTRVDPDTVSRAATPVERSIMSAHVHGRLNGLGPAPVRSVVCLYTVTPDFGFVIDTHPAMHRVLVVSPCSGHGFKHSAAIGEAVAERVATGASTIDLCPFALGRFT